MPKPLAPDRRAAILDAIRAGGTCRGIARKHNVSPDTVRRIAADAGIEQPFARTNTENATRAKQADNRAKRAALASRLLAKANELLDQMDQPITVWNFGGKDNTFNSVVVDRPPISDQRNLMTAAAVAIDKHIVIDRHDSGAGAEQAASLLGSLFQTLQERHGSAPE